MPERITFVLVESSFIIQSGLELLLQEFPIAMLIATYDGSEKKLADKIQGKRADIIIINPEILQENLTGIVNQLNKNGKCLVGLVNRNTPANLCSPFKYCLNINDEKYELLEVLKKITGTRFTDNSKKIVVSKLSEREETILKQVAYGLTNQDIADKLFLSIHTITTHRKNITRKLGIKTVSGLTVYALMNKIVDLNEIEQK